jgi:hypothetical protein
VSKPSATSRITFVVAVNNRELFERNFLASPCLAQLQQHQILVQENFNSATKAYNDAIEHSRHDLLVFCHQDVILPESWPSELERALDYLEATDPNWGVLGCSGTTADRHHPRYVYSSGLGVSGKPLPRPESVQTLDELVLVLKKSRGLRFDDSLPHFHLYGTDICLRAAERGMKSYAISAFCIHNTNQYLVLPAEFYECCRYIKRVWRHSLPIQTTCIRITKFNWPIYRRRVREFYLRHIRRKELGGRRVDDPLALLEEFVDKA